MYSLKNVWLYLTLFGNFSQAKCSHFNRNPRNWTFCMRVKDFPTQILQWLQIGYTVAIESCDFCVSCVFHIANVMHLKTWISALGSVKVVFVAVVKHTVHLITCSQQGSVAVPLGHSFCHELEVGDWFELRQIFSSICYSMSVLYVSYVMQFNAIIILCAI